MKSTCAILFAVAMCAAGTVHAKSIILDAKLHHLRTGPVREWSDYPQTAEGPKLSLSFQSGRNSTEWTLRLRQQDVKQSWRVLLNGKEIAKLPPDQCDAVLYFSIAAGMVKSGENLLVIEQGDKIANDVRIGEVFIDDRPMAAVLSEATVEITVLDAGRGDKPTPCRLTIVNDKGALMTTSAVSGGRLAVRPGVVYSGNGKAKFGLPAGDYTVYANRGFAYGIDSVKLSPRPGDTVQKTLRIRREVELDGWVSCAPHVHTLTYSGHGDSTDRERVITLAGEGIELPIITDHNKHIDLNPVAVEMGVRAYFTPVVGNEVTTSVGHFNIFPVRADHPVPDFKGKDWASVFQSLAKASPKVIVLNHPRDLHSGYRPFGPEHHLALTGDNLDGWELRANAIEVVNSGAQQTDAMQPLHDWLALLNRGLSLTPVGSSDSHDVSRSIVGQGRTYIRCKSDDPDNIDAAEAVKNFVDGRVMVSCGLLAEMTVNDKYGPGDLVPAADAVKVSVRVLGPSWTTADRVELYANGIKIRESAIKDGKKAGIKWSGDWTLPRFKHDVHLVAITSGPGVTEPYWPIQKPYQPTSPVVIRRVIGATGAIWLDADGDGKRTSARAYAERLTKEDWPAAIKALADYDEAVAVQAAALLQAKGVSLRDDKVREAARNAGEHVVRAFDAYAEAWRDSQVARETMKKR